MVHQSVRSDGCYLLPLAARYVRYTVGWSLFAVSIIAPALLLSAIAWEASKSPDRLLHAVTDVNSFSTLDSWFLQCLPEEVLNATPLVFAKDEEGGRTIGSRIYTKDLASFLQACISHRQVPSIYIDCKRAFNRHRESKRTTLEKLAAFCPLEDQKSLGIASA